MLQVYVSLSQGMGDCQFYLVTTLCIWPHLARKKNTWLGLRKYYVLA